MLLFIALFPVVALLVFIYMVDRYQHEPWPQMLKAVFYGVISAMLVVNLLSMFAPTFDHSVLGAVGDAFFNAAIPEEGMKLLMLWAVLRHSPYYDEYFDGIVYAVCVSLGFAGIENIGYVLSAEDAMSVGVSRAITAVPAHFMFGVTMGYYYSLVHFKFHPDERTALINKVCVLAVPVLFHGLYDAALMVMDVAVGYNILLSGACFVVFLAVCVYMVISVYRKCKHLLAVDQAFLEYQRQQQLLRQQEMERQLQMQQQQQLQMEQQLEWERQWEQLRQQWLQQHRHDNPLPEADDTKKSPDL